MTYVSELGPRELPKSVYAQMIEEHMQGWKYSKDGESSRGVSVACDDGFNADDIFPYRTGTGYSY